MARVRACNLRRLADNDRWGAGVIQPLFFVYERIALLARAKPSFAFNLEIHCSKKIARSRRSTSGDQIQVP